MRTQISKPEYALVIAATAQKLTGSKTATPSAKQVAEAQKQAKDAVLKAGVGVQGGTTKIDKLFDRTRNELSGISGMGDDECGSLWESIKDAIIKAAPIAPFIGPASGFVAPAAAIIAKQRAGQAAAAAAARAALAQNETTPEGSTSMVSTSGADSISYFDYVDLVNAKARKMAGSDSPAKKFVDEARRQVDGDLRRRGIEIPRWTGSAAEASLEGESISSVYDRAFSRLAGDDADVIYGEGGGAAELAAAARNRRGIKVPYYLAPFSSGADPSDITPTAYRMAVLQRARKLSRGTRPSTKQFFAAQSSVDRDLSSGGISLFIPGAQPGRVTR